MRWRDLPVLLQIGAVMVAVGLLMQAAALAGAAMGH